MGQTRLSPSLKIVPFADLESGAWAYATINRKCRLILKTDQESPLPPHKDVLAFGPTGPALQHPAYPVGSCAKLNAEVRLVLPIEETPTHVPIPRVREGEVMCGITSYGQMIGVTDDANGSPAYVEITGGKVSQIKSLNDVEGFWWHSGILEYRDSEHDEWRMLRKLEAGSAADTE